MTNDIMIHVPVPEEMAPTNVELLRSLFEAMVRVRCDCSQEWERIVRELQCDGWNVKWRLTWIAEAKRGEDYEQVSGDTLDKVLDQLQQMARLDTVANCP